MATALLNALPFDVASKVNEYSTELSVTNRLNSGWKLIHWELEWRVWGPILRPTMMPMRWPGYLILRKTPNIPPYFLPLYSRLAPAMCKDIQEDIEYGFSTRSSTERGENLKQLNKIITAAGILLGMPTNSLKENLGEWIQIERAVAVANDTPFNELPDFPESDIDDESYWETDGEDWQGADWEPNMDEDLDF